MSLLTAPNRLSLAVFAWVALFGSGWAAGEDEEVRGFVAVTAGIGLLAGAAALLRLGIALKDLAEPEEETS